MRNTFFLIVLSFMQFHFIPIALADEAAQKDNNFQNRVEAARRRARAAEATRQAGPQAYLAIIGSANVANLSATAGSQSASIGEGWAPNAALAAHIPFSTGLGGELSLQYNSRKLAIGDTSNYISINPEVKFWTSPQFALGLGPYYALATTENAPNDFGISFGAHGNLPLTNNQSTSLLLGAEFQYGLKNLLPETEAIGARVNYIQMQLNVGIGFAL